MLLHIHFHFSFTEQLLLHSLLHAEDPVLVDQVIRAQTDFQPGPLTVGGQPLYLCILEIVLQVLADFQFWKYIKKGFGHLCKLQS